MKIVTSSEKTFDADWVLDTQEYNGIQQLVIQMPIDIEPVRIFQVIVGEHLISVLKDNGNRSVFENYTKFRSLIVTPDRKSQRLTLER